MSTTGRPLRSYRRPSKMFTTTPKPVAIPRNIGTQYSLAVPDFAKWKEINSKLINPAAKQAPAAMYSQ